MNRLDELQNLAFKLFDRTDNIINRKIQNPIARAFWNKIGKPYGVRSIQNSSEQELIADLNGAYSDFKEFFENKQMKDMLNEGNKLSGMRVEKLLVDTGKFKEVSKYF